MAANSASCFHCGLPADGKPDVTLQHNGELLRFCCPGCRAIAQTILDGGLGRYYDYRESPGQRAETATDTSVARDDTNPEARYSRYDRPEFQQDFVSNQDGQHTALLNIGGISCAACTWLIEQRLGHVPGVDSVHVNLAKHRASITWREDTVALSSIFAVIDGIGYTPSPHSPDHEEQLLEQEQRTALKRLGVAALGMMQVGMFAIALHAGQIQGMDTVYRDYLRLVSLVVATVVVFYAARPFFQSAWRGLRNRSLGMDVPVSLAIGLAYMASCWATFQGSGDVYFDSIAMFTFFLLGSRYLEMRGRHQSERVAKGLAALKAPYAWRLPDPDAPGSQLEQIPASQLITGDTMVIKPGELVPADGIVVSGHSSIDESAFSGEYLPVAKMPGDRVTAGSINADGLLHVRVSAESGSTQLDTITRLLERAQATKPRSAQMADRLASHFVLAVLLVAATTAAFWLWRQPEQAFWVALSVLVVSCPCALSLATPSAVTAALAKLKSQGILLSRSHVLEALPQTTTVVFDKTGTLTTGALQRHRTHCLAELDASRCTAIAAALERHSNHPIATAFGASEHQSLEAVDIDIQIGQGITGTIDGQQFFLGSERWIASMLPAPASPDGLNSHQDSQTPYVTIVLASASKRLARFELHDPLRPDAVDALAVLREQGLKLRMLSGDSSGAVGHVAEALNLHSYQGGLSPGDKLHQLDQWRDQGERLVMVGDGINDVPVLAAAHISVAMVNASDLAKASADCLLFNGRLDSLNRLFDTARRTRRVITQNLSWALLYNLTTVPLAAAGQIPPWLAAIGMSASSLIVVSNAQRLRRHRSSPRAAQNPGQPGSGTVAHPVSGAALPPITDGN